MGQSKGEIADGRADTDASLGAERATSDANSSACAANALRILDDLIERDRTLADQTLLSYRVRADRKLLRERSDSPAPSSSVSSERTSADQRKQGEREVTDALLHRERHRSDTAVEVERGEHAAHRVELETRRHTTDDQLSSERLGADGTACALVKAKSALAQARTEQAWQDDVLAMVAHDLRSPLSVISMRSESIAETTRDASIRTAAGAITLSAARMARLVTDLLDVARIESGKLEIVKQLHDVGALLLDVLRAYGPMFSDRNITFSIDKPGASLEACFDHDRIIQVLSNLLGNAMKFTPPGGIVTLRVEEQADQLLFTLSDNGPGIPSIALPHIFERFWQIQSDTHRGLGLGLHICENIIRAHEGRIWVQSEYGKGATFQFTLPVP